jgi:hypothetical protein
MMRKFGLFADSRFETVANVDHGPLGKDLNDLATAEELFTEPYWMVLDGVLL